jgi:hypothetical protein
MAVVTIWISVILRPFQYGWIMAEHLGFGNHSNNTPPDCSVVKIQLDNLAGFGIIGPIRKQAGVDVEAGRYINNPPIWSTIAKIVAKPAGTSIIRNMMKTKTYTAEWHDKTEDFRVVRWEAPVNGVRMGTSIEAFDTEEEAMEVAALLNQGEELDLYHSQACEYDI